MVEVLGIIGAIFILSAWIYETIESIKKHKALIDLKFAAISIIGIVLLLFYSIQIRDIIFTFINIVLIVLVGFEIVYTIYAKKLRYFKFFR